MANSVRISAKEGNLTKDPCRGVSSSIAPTALLALLEELGLYAFHLARLGVILIFYLEMKTSGMARAYREFKKA